MGIHLRRNWSNRSGADPSTWELPVNQASKWLVPKSGDQRILGEGGSMALVNDNQRAFVISVFVGDGGSVTVGGTSGQNTIQISRTGNTISVTARPNSGSATTKTATTDMPLERWANVYLKCRATGLISNQVTVTYQVDFKTGVELIATGDLFGNSFPLGGKTLLCNSLSGWAWFAKADNGLWGWGAATKVPIDDAKYREAVLNNATWDLDNAVGTRTYNRPAGLKFSRQWLIQGGGGDGADGYNGSTGNCTNGSPGSDGGKGGNDGDAGTAGGPGGSGGQSYEPVEKCEDVWDPKGGTCDIDNNCTGGWVRQCHTEYEWVCRDGSGGSGGKGGKGGRGVMIMADIAQEVLQITVGAAGSKGTGNGGNGTNGGHTRFGSVSTQDALPYNSLVRSPTSIRYGVTEFVHGLGDPNGPGGIVFYYKW
ncbi:hypothetical protein TIN4_22 [Tsukamurella phage TIN4]|uniref:Uncharacterized protein n=2 Tax=Tinduovirus TIN3 TaxID=1982571 RepID=A0A0K0N607_9CAUD|nr:hypothetical protein AVT54_gp103 [Tsukamurella phage TIN3]YP_009604152.1 hypothetical protein FDH87_gp103 [Tsukamurella phage TIN4]AKJ71819.1 hypothetical protein TIN3_22 [Tsukamurella phage TIN3]AKJ71928.1 hypothetical protein TIN4_22 [Tsukamurella phage TIN4]